MSVVSETQRCPVARRLVFLSVCALGVSSLVTQLTLMRELVCAFSGNELVFGIVLGNWLLLTGLGAAAGGRMRFGSPAARLAIAQSFIAVLPLIQVYAVRTLRNRVFLPGLQVGVVETALASAVILLPYCVIAGALLTLACRLLAPTDGASSIGRVYFMDTLGDIGGGVFFSLALLLLSDHFGILVVPTALNLLAALAVAFAARHRLALATTVAVGVAALGVLTRVDLDETSLARQYSPARVVFHEQSPYGSVVVTESAGQLDFIESGVPLFSTDTPEQAEETVHYAMTQRPDARHVLLVSGGVSGTARELLKYPAAAIDYVELDPSLLRVAKRYVPEYFEHPRVAVIRDDGRRFVQQTERRYDVVIVDLPDPSTLQLNRFYTEEFFRAVARVLNPGGVLEISLAHYENAVSDQLAALLSVADATLRRVFARTRIVPGASVYLLASNGRLDADVAAVLEARGIETKLLHRSYLAAVLGEDRVGDVVRSLDGGAPSNRDLDPALHDRQLSYWTSQFAPRLGTIGAVMALLLGAYLLRSGPISFAIFSGGCAASTLEVVVLLGFQAIHGFVYQRVGIIVTLSIAGLAVGSLLMNRGLLRRRRRDLVSLQFAIALFAGLLPMLVGALTHLGSGLGAELSADVIFPLLAFIPGVLTGMEFPLAGREDFRGVGATAARLYTADFVGAAVGAMLVGAVLIPMLSVTLVCLLVAGLNLLSGSVVWAATKA